MNRLTADTATAGRTHAYLGATHRKAARRDSAVLHLEAALRLLSAPTEALSRRQALLDLAVVHQESGRHEAALQRYGEVLPLLREAGDSASLGWALYERATLLYRLGRSDSIQNHLREAIPLLKSAGDRLREGRARYQLGQSLVWAEPADSALSQLEAAVPLLELMGGLDEQGQAYYWLGVTLARNQRRTEALVSLRKALPLLRAAAEADSGWVAWTHQRIGWVLAEAGQLDSALVAYRAALPLLSRASDAELAGFVLNDIGAVFHRQSARDSALSYLRTALQIRAGLPDSAAIEQTLLNLVDAHWLGSSSDSAVIYLDRVARLQEARGSPVLATTLIRAGNLLTEQGHTPEAVVRYRRALHLRRLRNERPGEVTAHRLLGIAFSDLGEPDSAFHHLRSAVFGKTELRDTLGMARAYNDLARLHFAVEQNDSALAGYQRALSLWATTGRRDEEAVTLANLGLVFRDVLAFDSAFSYLRTALTFNLQAGDSTGVGRVSNLLGDLHGSTGQIDSAFLYLRRAARVLAGRDTVGMAGTLHSLGNLFAAVSEPDSAKRLLRQVLEIRRAIRHRPGEGTALTSLGALFQELGEPDSALTYYHASLPIHRAVHNRASETSTLNGLGQVHASTGRPDSALAYYRASLAVATETGRRSAVGAALNNIGKVFLSIGEPDSARGYLGRALPLARASRNPVSEAATLSLIGDLHLAAGEPDSARVQYLRALQLEQEARSPAGIARISNVLGELEATLGNTTTALDAYREALTTLIRAGRRREAILVLLNLGRVHSRAGNPDSASVHYHNALAMARAARDLAGEATVLMELGDSFSTLGEPDSAQAYLTVALERSRQIGGQGAGAAVVERIGDVQLGLGQFYPALTSYAEALERYRRVRLPADQASALTGIGAVYLALQRADSAELVLRQALPLWRQAQSRTGEARTLHLLGRMHGQRGARDSARTAYIEALRVRRAAMDRIGEGSTLLALGMEAQQADTTLSLARSAETLFVRARFRSGTASALALAGIAHHQLGRPDSAATALRRAVSLHRGAGDRDATATDMMLLAGVLHRDLGDLAAATAYYDTAAAWIAAVRGTGGSDDNRLSFAEGRSALYPLWALAWLQRGSAGEVPRSTAALAALAAAERGRAQALLDLLGTRGSPESAGATIAAEGARLLREATRDGSAVLFYLLARDSLVVLASSGAEGLYATVVPVAGDTLRKLVQGVRNAAGRGEDLERCLEFGRAGGADASLHELARLLLPDTVRRILANASGVVIVPQGILQQVPFAALPLKDGVPLGLRYALRYTPSLGALARAAARPALDRGQRGVWNGAVIVGDPHMPTVPACGVTGYTPPRLRDAGRFSAELADRLGVRFLGDVEAEEWHVRSLLSQAHLVHFATHGYAYQAESRARFSWIALAAGHGQDGLLTVADVLDGEPLRAELVVLAACATGLGHTQDTEGTVGLQRAFLSRGARSVLVSLWVVREDVAVALLREFYRGWLEQGWGKAEALQHAQQQVRDRFRDSYDWAAFQLVGAN